VPTKIWTATQESQIEIAETFKLRISGKTNGLIKQKQINVAS
jgi:hypothetical protein